MVVVVVIDVVVVVVVVIVVVIVVVVDGSRAWFNSTSCATNSSLRTHVPKILGFGLGAAQVRIGVE